MELKQCIRIARKWLWLIALGTLLAGGVAYAVSSLLSPAYRASTSLLITASGDDDYSTTLANQYLTATYKELLTKRPVIERAALNLGLDLTAVDRLAKGVVAWVVPGTSVVRLAVEHGDPRLAMDLANEIASVFMQTQRERGERSAQAILVVEPARQPSEPIAPRKTLNTLVAVIGGCALATGVALLLEHLDGTLTTEEDVTEGLSQPVMAVVPHTSRRQKREANQMALAPLAPCHADAYRALHTRLRFWKAGSGSTANTMPNTILVTSPSFRREKADLAVNLGLLAAQDGLRVLLVDADLQQPTLHRMFGLTNETGLTTLLAGHGGCKGCIARTDIPNLCVLPSGPLTEVSALSSLQVPHLLEELGVSADAVLLDAAPVLETADTMLLAAQTQGTLLALESGFTRRRVAIRAMEQLRGVAASMLGVVLNQA